MDPSIVVLDISSDEDVDWNDNERRVSDGGDDSNWFTELVGDEKTKIYGDDSDEVVVVKEFEKPVKKSKLKSSLVDSDDECVVLDRDPNAPAEVRNDNSGNGDDDDDSDDIVVVSEKGQVACRDYPHSRHLCIKFTFSTTPHQTHCDQCYCYVCDSLAPCIYWGNGSSSVDHCHATDKYEFWKVERKNVKNGSKTVQPVSQPSPVDPYAPPPVIIQPPNQIPKPGPINHYRNQLHPDLVSQLVIRAQQKYNQGSMVHRPVFKRTHPLRAVATGHQNRYSSYRGNLGNPIRQNSYQSNGMLSGSSNYVVNPSVPYPPQSQNQTFASLTANQLNPSFQPHVNSNPPYRPHVPQPVSSQLTYMVPVQPSYHVQPKTQVDNPLVSDSGVTQNVSQASESNQGPVVDTGFKDYGLGLPTGQDSATNGSTLETVPGGLADYRFDWMFDNQSIEPGFPDYSSDTAFIDTGPIFEF